MNMACTVFGDMYSAVFFDKPNKMNVYIQPNIFKFNMPFQWKWFLRLDGFQHFATFQSWTLRVAGVNHLTPLSETNDFAPENWWAWKMIFPFGGWPGWPVFTSLQVWKSRQENRLNRSLVTSIFWKGRSGSSNPAQIFNHEDKGPQVIWLLGINLPDKNQANVGTPWENQRMVQGSPKNHPFFQRKIIWSKPPFLSSVWIFSDVILEKSCIKDFPAISQLDHLVNFPMPCCQDATKSRPSWRESLGLLGFLWLPSLWIFPHQGSLLGYGFVGIF